MHKVGFVVFPAFQVSSFEVVTVFEVANLVIGERSYSVRVIAEGGGLVPCSAGFKVDAEPFSRSRFDTVIIAPGLEIEWPSAGLVRFVRQSLKTARRLAAPCTGAFILAEAGVLDGRRATTHWAFARELKSRFPEVSVEEDRIFMVDGSVWTSAGMTAAIDLALAMVERDHGAEVGSRSFRPFSTWNRRPTASRKPSPTPALTCRRTFPLRRLLSLRGSVHVSLVARFTKKLRNRQPRPSSTFALKRRG